MDGEGDTTGRGTSAAGVGFTADAVGRAGAVVLGVGRETGGAESGGTGDGAAGTVSVEGGVAGRATGSEDGSLSRSPGQIRSGLLSVRPSASRAFPRFRSKIVGQRFSSPRKRAAIPRRVSPLS